VISASLNSQRQREHYSSTSGQRSSTRRQSSIMPMVMKKEAQQHVVEGPDVGFHLVLEFGLGDQHAGDESAERQRQAGVLGQPGQAEGDQQQVEHEQLVAFLSCDQGQPPAHDGLPARQQQPEQHHCLEQRPGRVPAAGLPGRPPAPESAPAGAPRPDPGTTGPPPPACRARIPVPCARRRA
jgi:hypothetical protein